VTQRKICLAADITEATIRNRNKDLKKVLKKNEKSLSKIKKNSRHKLHNSTS
jgi:transcription initiation factor TFIIIB Brf1 subunit/transcription initiation factor TFIIB